jgi:L-lactate permease
MVFSTFLAALLVLVIDLGFMHPKAHIAAGARLASALLIAVFAFGMLKVLPIRLCLSPNLTGAANNSGGVIGKIIDGQSIVVASTATRWFNHEGDILRYVFFHSIALACLVGLLVTLQAYVPPFTSMVVR